MKKIVLMTLLAGIAFSHSSIADVWAEREALSRIKTELASIEALIKNAEGLHDPQARQVFNYELLIDDMRKIQAGIQAHLDNRMEPIVPSKIDALKADYTVHGQ